MSDDRYIFTNKHCLNGTTYSHALGAYQCGSCVKLITHEQILDLHLEVPGIKLCPHCGAEALKTDHEGQIV